MLFDFVLLLIAILPLFDARRIQNLLRRSALKLQSKREELCVRARL